jgi:hypothetical protein
MAGLGPAIHVLRQRSKTWMPAFAGMTTKYQFFARAASIASHTFSGVAGICT